MVLRIFDWLWEDASPRTQSDPPRLSMARKVIVALLAALAASFAARVLLGHRVDSDTLWHIRTGQWIVENGRIPATDVFSWIGAERGLAWTPHEWLFDGVLWGLYSKTGFVGIYALTSVTFGAYAFLVFSLAYRRSGAWTMSLLISSMAMVGTAPFIAPRPQIATFALLTAVALLLEQRRPYLALAAMLIGVNVHGAMYPVYLGLFAFYCLPRKAWTPLLLAVVTTTLTPIGTQLLPYPLFAFDPQVALFQEYAPTVLRQSWALLLAFIGIVLLVDRNGLPRWDALLAWMLALLSISAVRHTSLFFGIALPMLAPYLRFPDATNQGGARENVALTRRLPEPDTILVVVLAIAVALSTARWWGQVPDPHDRYPKAAVDWIEQQGVRRIWNEWGDGGYLIYRGVPTFVDGRADPFSPFFDPEVTIAKDVAAAYYLKKDPREVTAQYGITHTLLRRSSPLYLLFAQSRDFASVYADADYEVFITRDGDKPQ